MGLDSQKAQLGSLFQCVASIPTEPADIQRLQVNWGREIEAILNWGKYNIVWWKQNSEARPLIAPAQMTAVSDTENTRLLLQHKAFGSLYNLSVCRRISSVLNWSFFHWTSFPELLSFSCERVPNILKILLFPPPRPFMFWSPSVFILTWKEGGKRKLIAKYIREAVLVQGMKESLKTMDSNPIRLFTHL